MHQILLDNEKLKACASVAIPDAVMARYAPEIQAADDKEKEAPTLNIYGAIGETYDGTGITARLVQSVLRQSKGADITVNINSPGGSYFDGVAIYNQLRAYEGNVQVRIIGMAASAASVIALAGDEVLIAETGFYMIHNTWTLAIGDRHAMQEMVLFQEKLDGVMRDLYAARTGKAYSDIEEMMDAETWLTGKEALEEGFADGLFNEVATRNDSQSRAVFALRQVENALAKTGLPRAQRRKLINEIKGTQDATPAMQDAGHQPAMQDAGQTVQALHKLATLFN